MSRFQLFNGQYHPEGEKLLEVTNRGFCYGDGFFESMRISNGRSAFNKGHWQRLQRACGFLNISIPEDLSEATFLKYTLELVGRNGLKDARVRFQGYRMGEGRYAPENNRLGWAMVCQPMESPEYRLNPVGLKVGICTTHRINPAPQSSFKSSNSLPYVLGGMFAKKHGLDDCLLLDSHGFIAEATGSNVFVLKGSELLTPDLSNGGVPGVMRTVVMQEAAALGLRVRTAKLSETDLYEADECFLTNAARGIQWVAAIEMKRYFKRQSLKLTDHINQRFGLLS